MCGGGLYPVLVWSWLVPFVRVEVVRILCECRGTLFLYVEVVCASVGVVGTLCQGGGSLYSVCV